MLALDLANSQEIAAQADLIVKRGVLEQLVGRPVGALKPLVKDAKIDGVLLDKAFGDGVTVLVSLPESSVEAVLKRFG